MHGVGLKTVPHCSPTVTFTQSIIMVDSSLKPSETMKINHF